MRWPDERFVKVYTRNTTDWLALGWESHALFWELLRMADRAGLFELGKSGTRGIAAVTGIPVEVVERALAILLEDGCVERHGTYLLIRNFIEAQEANQSDKARAAKARTTARDRARLQDVKPSHFVTPESSEVTNCDSKEDSVTRSGSLVTQTGEASRPEEKRLDEPEEKSLERIHHARDPMALVPPQNEHGKPTPRYVVERFLAIRSEMLVGQVPGANGIFQQPQSSDIEKAASWLSGVSADECLDIEPSIRLACSHVRDGAQGWAKPEMAKVGYLFGCIVRSWPDLREELHGCSPIVASSGTKGPRGIKEILELERQGRL
jgi:hypothetical protein